VTDSERKAWEFAEKVLGVAHEAVRLHRASDAPSRLVVNPAACACYLHHEPHIHVPSDAVSVDAWSAYAKKLAEAAGVTRVVTEPPDAQALVEARIRDAALEEADKAILLADRKDRRDLYPTREEYAAHYCGWTAGANAALDAVRALKSKPATISAFAALDALQRACMEHAAAKWEHGEMDGPAPEPIHDFGWALQQMRAGKKVRREAWEDRSAFVSARAGLLKMNGTNSDFTPWESTVFATDWQVLE
jgi:nucleotide-binding universal stress UspA family protein